MEKNKTLVVYFSPTGTTASVAKQLAEAAGADLLEIVPQQPYTSRDLNWNDRNSRSSITGSVSALKRGYPALNWGEGRLLNSPSVSSLRNWLTGK